MGIENKRVINGSFGSVWVDNDLWADVESFEAVANIDYEDVNQAGSLATGKKQVGWNGTGSMKIKKVFSRVNTKFAEGIKTGQVPRIKIVGKLADPDAYGTERIAIYDVTVDSVTLMKYEQKALGSIDLPFSFSDFELIDSITEV